TWPPKMAAEIDSAIGLHPVLGMQAYEAREFAPDDYAHRAGPLRTPEEEQILFDGLLRGVRAKQRLTSTLFAQDNWDFFLSIFSESHCIGHQQWHLHDHTHPRFDRTTLEGLGSNPVTHIYRELDTALGDMLARACDDTVVLVLLSHGMGPHYDGTHLLDTILSRIDGFNRATGNYYNPRKLRNRVVASLPRALQESATAFAVPVIRHYLKRRSIIPCSEYASRKE